MTALAWAVVGEAQQPNPAQRLAAMALDKAHTVKEEPVIKSTRNVDGVRKASNDNGHGRNLSPHLKSSL